MSQPSPLASPEPWNLVAPEYAAEILPMFTGFAEEALRLAALGGGARLLDVAAGPGTLALRAAAAGARTTALDFSAGMVARLRENAAAQGAAIEVHQGDGQALPFADESFDAAASLFGVIFFPDRARGLSELRRVLRPGGVAMVSSWPPFSRAPAAALLFGAIREEVPMPAPAGDPPLGTPELCRAELGAAGLRDVQVHEAVQLMKADSTEELWASFQRTNAMLRLLEVRMGPQAWERASRGALQRLQAKLGTGPQELELPALISIGWR